MTDLRKRAARSQDQPPADLLANQQPDGSAPDGDGKTAVNGADWRELARRIQNESDSSVMMDLVQQLIVKLDEEKSRKTRAGQK